jgi:DNA-binding transcriptional LysR family regulator
MMQESIPSLSTDQVLAFVELARQGSLRNAAKVLRITEQALRNRILTLEMRLSVSLYTKQRGPRRATPLTRQGEIFLPHALAFLERGKQLAEVFSGPQGPEEIHVAATQYLIMYALIDVIRRFHRAHPGIRVRLSTHTEMEIEHALLREPELSFGVAAPYESGGELEYIELFSLDWSLITLPGHRLLKKPGFTLVDLADQPMILFERGSTGRQHVMDAFHEVSLSPRVELEATSTAVVVRMVEAGLGVSLVPLLPGGQITRGHKVGTRRLPGMIRPIHSGILYRRGEHLSPASKAFIEFLKQKFI